MEKPVRVLWKWDNTIWTLIRVTLSKRYVIQNEKDEITKVEKDEIIFINE